MSTEIIVAVVASIASLVVALVSLVTALVTGRQSSRSAEQLEVLKHTLAAKQKRADQTMTALLAGIQAIQHVKDEVQIILDAPPSALDADIAIERVRASREAVFSCFEANDGILDESERDAFHGAKSDTLKIENAVAMGLQGKSDASALTDQDRRQLRELRGKLTDAQQVLRDQRVSMMSEALKHD